MRLQTLEEGLRWGHCHCLSTGPGPVVPLNREADSQTSRGPVQLRQRCTPALSLSFHICEKRWFKAALPALWVMTLWQMSVARVTSGCPAYLKGHDLEPDVTLVAWNVFLAGDLWRALCPVWGLGSLPLFSHSLWGGASCSVGGAAGELSPHPPLPPPSSPPCTHSGPGVAATASERPLVALCRGTDGLRFGCLPASPCV